MALPLQEALDLGFGFDTKVAIATEVEYMRLITAALNVVWTIDVKWSQNAPVCTLKSITGPGRLTHRSNCSRPARTLHRPRIVTTPGPSLLSKGSKGVLKVLPATFFGSLFGNRGSGKCLARFSSRFMDLVTMQDAYRCCAGPNTTYLG